MNSPIMAAQDGRCRYFVYISVPMQANNFHVLRVTRLKHYAQFRWPGRLFHVGVPWVGRVPVAEFREFVWLTFLDANEPHAVGIHRIEPGQSEPMSQFAERYKGRALRRSWWRMDANAGWQRVSQRGGESSAAEQAGS